MSRNVPPERAERDIRTERQRLTGFQCPTMSHNVPECPTRTGRTGHPHRAETTYRISMSHNVPECPGMSHFRKKRAGLRWVQGSRFKVQRWGFLTKCDGLQRPMQRNATVCNTLMWRCYAIKRLTRFRCNGLQRFRQKRPRLRIRPPADSLIPQHVFHLLPCWSRTTKCDGLLHPMSHNVPQCPTLTGRTGHPNRA